MKRIHSIHEDANSGCGCQENLWVLKAPWTSYAIPAIGPRIDVDMGATEFTRDVTDVVKKWLDGTVVNNGLLLLAGESPCSGGRKCFSCYEAEPAPVHEVKPNITQVSPHSASAPMP